jgi:intracellular multiplication protein IcmV
MAIRDIFKVGRKTFINPTRWVGLDSIIRSTNSIVAITSDLFTLPEAGKKESFAQAAKRLKLGNRDITKTARFYLISSYVFFFPGVFAFIYGFYITFKYKVFAAVFLGLATSALFMAYAFRYNFCYFQIKHRKLGCTFKEWLSGKVSDAGTVS